ncbi:unnamed protein product [Symbiodinium microadriaticum]|nr:unnamed protein product [Symbiodinium microadriaticum]
MPHQRSLQHPKILYVILPLLLPSPPAMSDMTREELVAVLAKHGVEAPRGWTKVEMLLRVEQLTGQDMSEKVKPKASKGRSPFQEMVTKLNQAARRKSVLVEFVTTELRMSNMENYTIDRIKMEAIRRIYDVVEAHGSDQLGFGKYSVKTYAEESDNHKRGRKKSTIQETTPEHNILQALMEQVAELKDEIKEMRQDKQATSATGSQEPTKAAKNA